MIIKHRIFIIFAIVGLIILILPFFENRKVIAVDEIMMKPPVFPNESLQITMDNSPANYQKKLIKIKDKDEIVSPLKFNANDIKEKAILLADNIHSYNSKQEQGVGEVSQKNSRHEEIDAKKKLPVVKKIPHISKELPSIKSLLAYSEKHSLSNNLIKLKNSAWVVQIGKYNNKSNALHIANQLRECGYKAFIQQVSSQTRVYVGPENKRKKAIALADKILNEMHIKGIIINYQPLVL